MREYISYTALSGESQTGNNFEAHVQNI